MSITKKSEVFLKLEEVLIQKLKSKKYRIPVMPEVAGKVLSLVHQENVEISDLVSLLERDPVIAGHIIKVANSPAFTASGNIKNLTQAAGMLGTRLISEIAISVSLSSGVFITKGYKEYMRDVLKHTMGCVVLCKELLEYFDFDNDQIYLSALFHTAGMPVILYSLHEYKTDQKIEIEDTDIKMSLLYFQTRYTNMVLEKWGVDNEIRFIATHFIKYKTVEKYQKEVAFLSLLKKLTNWVFSEMPAEKMSELKEYEILGIDHQTFKSIFANREYLRKLITDLIKFL